MKTDIFLIQTGLKSLGFDPGPIDGLDGKNTRAAILAFEASVSKPQPAQPSGGSLKGLAKAIVEVALAEDGIRETSKNQGPGLAKYWTATTYPKGYENREPYCAAFVCWVVREAVGTQKVPFSLPRSPVAYDIEKWGNANSSHGVQVLAPAQHAPQAGDVFTLSTASHVGIVTGWDGTHVLTIEGNTDGSGSREGDGVYRRRRTRASLRKLVRLPS